jgi:uracil-DNA glycosylase family 4
MGDKIQRLKELNESLKFPQELGGVFLPKGSPKQFEFMFVAEMPSMNEPKNKSTEGFCNFSVTARDRFLKEMMTKYGVAGSYITDIVKVRDIPRRPTKTEIKKWLPFLLQEVEIIQPKAIVVLGRRTYDASFRPFVKPHINEGIKVDWVWHYSQQGQKSNAEIEQKFGEVINGIRKP